MSTVRKLQTVVLLALAAFSAGSAMGQTSAFTYQGQLKEDDGPINGSSNLVFKLFNAASGGAQVGPTVTKNGVMLDNGLFSELLDFGFAPFDGSPRWLELTVNGTTLTTRHELTATPYAMKTRGIFADTAANIGIGTNTPHHRLRISGGPSWTSYSWGGAIELDNAAAIGWQPNIGGSRFGIGQSTGGLYIFHTTSDPGTTGTPAVYDMVINDSGNVGIGATTPAFPLTIQKVGYGWVHTDGVRELGSYVSGSGSFLGTRSNHPLHLFTANSFEQVTLATSGNLGVGTNAPARRLHVRNNDLFGARFESTHQSASVVEFRSSTSNSTWEYGVAGSTNTPWGLPSGSMYLYRQGDPVPGMHIWPGAFEVAFNCADLRIGHPARRGTPGRAMVDLTDHLAINFASDWSYTFVHGRLRTNVLEVAGADLAEKFPCNEENVPPGTVMEIDPDHPGKLRVARESYTSRVAGVVSGAGDLQAGAVLGTSEASDGGPAIALSGRVWVQCDAGSGAIAPGDLLTTSETAGHAMKAVDRERSHGAVLGKAMTTLAKGERGLVLVLVNLQ